MFGLGTAAAKKPKDSQVVYGLGKGDKYHRTIFCGPDPAEPSRMLVKKIIQINDGTYAL